METTRRETGRGPIRLLFEVGPVAGLSDGQLLDRFLDRRAGGEEAAEVAFAALVERHGPMVLRACRAQLGDEHDAQDAFQATFLILARKAGTIRNRESASGWLRGVARKVASCARRASALRRAKERGAAGGEAGSVAEADRSDLVPAILEEVGGLPEADRAPLLLCLLDGLTLEEAAARLGWPVGTVKTRVRRAKARLRAALTRRGLAPSLGAIAAALAAGDASAMPAALARATARAAMGAGAGRALTQGLASASVAGLVGLGLGSLMMTRLKIAALLVTSVVVLAVGATGLARPSPKAQEGKPAEAPPNLKEAVAAPKARPDLKEAVAAPKLEPPEGVALEMGEEAQAERIDRIDEAQLDIDLLRIEVAELKDLVTGAMRNRLQAEAQWKSRMDSPDPGEAGQGGPKGLLRGGMTREQIAKQAQQTLESSRKYFEEARAAYLSKNRELKREERRVQGLAVGLPMPRRIEALRALTRSQQADGARPVADVEGRLSEVERKLDQVLKALKK